MDSYDDENQLGSVTSFGLSSVLASVGVDLNGFSNVFEKNGESSGRRFAEIEAEDGEEKYEDDISEGELGEESAEDRAARAREAEARKREEDRWYKRAMAMQARPPPPPKQTKAEVDQEILQRVWPDFKEGQRLKLTEVLYETPAERAAYREAVNRKKRRKLNGITEYPLLVTPKVDHSYANWQTPNLPELPESLRGRPLYETPLGLNFDPAWIKAARELRRKKMLEPPKAASKAKDEEDVEDDLPPGMALDLDDWEKNIIMFSGDVPVKKAPPDVFAPFNDLLEQGNWADQVIWDATQINADLIQTDDEEEEDNQAAKDAQHRKASSKLDPCNLSNDHIYEHTREARFRIRQTFGAIEVFHSGPAKALQLPFYKTTLSKTEARAWRRPAMQFPTGVSLSFSKLKSNPSGSMSSKKKQMMTDPSERFRTSKDLTMSEKGPYVLLEFSEEYPPIMSGYGMGTTIVNYYRKKNDNDEHIPQLDFGQPSILAVGDAEPFLLGYVDKGKVTQVIHNNLLRAPIWKHHAETTDFLVIRQTVNGHAHYYIRSIPNLFVVGQTVPNESEVPGPHARKNTTYARMRLQIVAWLLINKSKERRIKIGRLMKYFPDQTELQMRQRLKIKGSEFLIFNRSQGPHQGYWILNPNLPVEKDGTRWPNTREEVLQMASPESAMLYEAMQVGARHLHDAGYSKTAEGKDDADEDEAGLDIEQQLAVWSTTLNYKKAEQAKAWLIVHGEGDPTGRGEGVSFLKTNMKNYFLRRGETEQGRRLEAEAKANGNVVKISNSEQNRIYEEEKRLVWDLQAKALSSTVPPKVEAEDEERMAGTPVAFGPRGFTRSDSRRALSRSNSMAATPFYGESPRDFSPGATSVDGESTYTGNPLSGKVMRIKRIIKGKAHYEIVRDPAVIASYKRKVEERKIEEYSLETENLQATGNAEEDELRRIALMQKLENLKKNQARRAARRKYMNRELGDEADNEGKRRCGACGQQGHTRANRACPLYNETVHKTSLAAGGGAAAQSPAGATPGATPGMTPGGYSTGGPTPGAFFGDYFGSAGGDGSASTPSTNIKIRIGGGKRD